MNEIEKDILMHECYDISHEWDEGDEAVEKAIGSLVKKGLLRTQVIATEKGYTAARKIEIERI